LVLADKRTCPCPPSLFDFITLITSVFPLTLRLSCLPSCQPEPEPELAYPSPSPTYVHCWLININSACATKTKLYAVPVTVISTESTATATAHCILYELVITVRGLILFRSYKPSGMAYQHKYSQVSYIFKYFKALHCLLFVSRCGRLKRLAGAGHVYPKRVVV
jgi:hypothetical protein